MNSDAVFNQLKILWNEKEYEKAKQLLENALQKAGEEKQYQMYLNFGRELLTLYQFLKEGKAFDLAEDLLLLMEELQMEGSPEFATVLTNMAELYREAGKLKPAYQFYLQALRIYEEQYPAGHELFLSLYLEMSGLLAELGERENALVLMDQACGQLLQMKPCPKQKRTWVLTLAFLYLRFEKGEEAGRLFEHLLSSCDSTIKSTNSDAKKDLSYLVALSGLGEASFLSGAYKRSLDAYEKAGETMKKEYGETKEYAAILRNCSAACQQLNLKEKADYYKKKADQISEE